MPGGKIVVKEDVEECRELLKEISGNCYRQKHLRTALEEQLYDGRYSKSDFLARSAKKGLQLGSAERVVPPSPRTSSPRDLRLDSPDCGNLGMWKSGIPHKIPKIKTRIANPLFCFSTP